MLSAFCGLYAIFGVGFAPVRAEPKQAGNTYANFVNTNLLTAQARRQHQPDDVEAGWQFARACFDRADISTNNTERALIAEQGIAACELAVGRAPKSAAAHYYLGMNLAQLAQTKGLGALKIVNRMEREFALARDLDEKFDFAGPDRNLGLLYRDAPAVVSVGNRKKARQCLQRAVDLAPQYPENRLNLIEACLNWSDRPSALSDLKALEAIWPSARTNLTGVAWVSSWADWDQRLSKARKQLGQSPSP
jgi:tetratricopeptide (TPR) repeat protein